MAIFQRAYQGYDGAISAPLERTLVIFRYALADAFRSRLFVAFFAICFLPAIGLMCLLYTFHNLELLLQFDVDLDELVAINSEFFYFTMQVPHVFMLFALVVAIGPTMISPDLRNNAMPLYLSRSLSKFHYITGKTLVLLVLGSLITWVPGLLLILLQAYLGESGWLASNAHLLVAAPVISLTWLICLTLLAFAVSAFVKWKALARMAFFGVFFLGSALGAVIDEIFGGWAGDTVNLIGALEVLMAGFYRTESLASSTQGIPLWGAASVFLMVTLLAIIVLTRRIRAFQVVS